MALYKLPASMMTRSQRPIQFYGMPKQTWLRVYGPPLALIAMSLLFLDGCQVVKGIFEAGVGVGVFAVVAVLAVIGGIAAMVMRKK